jgi:hypothetical protein
MTLCLTTLHSGAIGREYWLARNDPVSAEGSCLFD